MIKIIVDYVDGSMSEWDEEEIIIEKLNDLLQRGYSGKILANNLITDDWGCPPEFISIEGIYENKEFRKTIRYE